jgi:hypothetical protein
LRDFVALSDARAVALPDARILLTGVDESGRARAFRVDVGRGVWEESGAPSRPVGALVLCDDGAIAEVGPIGAAYRRESLRTRYDNPPDTLFAADADWLALDVPSAYAERASEGLEALADGAPIMVPTLVFEDVVVMPTVAGAYRLVFTDDSGRTRTVSVDPERVSVDACEVMRGSEATFTATRRGDRVTIETSVDSRECPLADLVGGVRIELRLATTSRFQALSLARL